MWITSIHGHVSAVRDNTRPAFMRLRFRTHAHAENFAVMVRKRYHSSQPMGQLKVEETPAADYRWKFSVPKADWLHIVETLANEAMDYDNFKGACSRTPAMRQHGGTLHDAWAVWERVQREQAFPMPKSWPGHVAGRGPDYAKAPAKKAPAKKASPPDLSSSFDSAD